MERTRLGDESGEDREEVNENGAEEKKRIWKLQKKWNDLRLWMCLDVVSP